MPFLYLAVFLYSAFLLVQYLYTYYEASKSLKETQTIYEAALENTEEQEGTGDESKSDLLSKYTMRPQFKDLHAVNEDIVGWITVEGTKLNNPILQTDNNEFYLDRNFKAESSRAGSVFMDYRNDVTDMGRNTIMYGHAMKNDTMFGSLRKFAKQDYADEHSVIYVDTLYEGYDIEVFAAYETTTDFYYIETNFTSDDDFKHYIDEVESRSMIDMSTEVAPSDQIVTLSTCDNILDATEKRFVVQAKLVKR